MIMKRTSIKNLIFTFAVFFSFHLLAQDPPDISMTFYLEERSENGTLVGTVDATDPEGDPLTFSIVSGNDLGAFAINSSSGDLTVADEDQLNFDINPSFDLGVEANDGNGGITSVDITINLIDIPLGFDDSKETIRTYPNPVVDRLYVDLNGIQLENIQVTMHSMSGHGVIIRPTLTSNSKMEIAFTAIPKGVYILRIENEEGHFSKRLFVR